MTREAALEFLLEQTSREREKARELCRAFEEIVHQFLLILPADAPAIERQRKAITEAYRVWEQIDWQKPEAPAAEAKQ